MVGQFWDSDEQVLVHLGPCFRQERLDQMLLENSFQPNILWLKCFYYITRRELRWMKNEFLYKGLPIAFTKSKHQLLFFAQEETWPVATSQLSLYFWYYAYFGLWTCHCHKETLHITTVPLWLSADSAFYKQCCWEVWNTHNKDRSSTTTQMSNYPCIPLATNFIWKPSLWLCSVLYSKLK